MLRFWYFKGFFIPNPVFYHILLGDLLFIILLFLLDSYTRSLSCFSIFSKLDTPLCLCFLFFWFIDDPFSRLSCEACHTFFYNFLFIFSLELSQTSYVTVTQGLYNIFLLFPSGHPLYCFLLSHWWSILIVVLRGLSHFLLSFYQLVPFYCSFSEWNCPTLLAWLSHKVSIMFCHRLEVYTTLSCLLLSHWRPILFITLCGTYF